MIRRRSRGTVALIGKVEGPDREFLGTGIVFQTGVNAVRITMERAGMRSEQGTVLGPSNMCVRVGGELMHTHVN
jgi:hypothetical protein